MSKKILFSILVPAYKVEYLKECIDSVLSQTYSYFELIIVDDASPFDISSIVSLYNDSRIQYHRNEVGFGALNVIGNWNKCLSYATGDYAICMGDDDRLLPCCLEEYTRLIEMYPHLDVYHAWTQQIDEKGNVISVLEPRPEYETFYSMIYYRWKGRCQYIGDFCYKIEHLRENNGFYYLPLAWGSDDISAARAALPHGVANSTKLCFEYRQSSITISKSAEHTRIKLDSLLKERRWFKEILSDINESELDQTDKWYYSQTKLILEPRSIIMMTNLLLLDIRSNPLSFFLWIKDCAEYGISRFYLFKKVLKDIGKKH